jgi:hypothetical protein
MAYSRVLTGYAVLLCPGVATALALNVLVSLIRPGSNASRAVADAKARTGSWFPRNRPADRPMFRQGIVRQSRRGFRVNCQNGAWHARGSQPCLSRRCLLRCSPGQYRRCSLSRFRSLDRHLVCDELACSFRLRAAWLRNLLLILIEEFHISMPRTVSICNSTGWTAAPGLEPAWLRRRAGTCLRHHDTAGLAMAILEYLPA